jgi:hypothetical protein
MLDPSSSRSTNRAVQIFSVDEGTNLLAFADFLISEIRVFRISITARCRRRNRRQLVATLLDFSASTPDTVQSSVSTTSPNTTGKPRGTSVNATLPPHECVAVFPACSSRSVMNLMAS